NRNIITFYTLFNFLKIIILFQGTINSIIQFIRVIITILEKLFPKVIILFINNISIKRLYTNYNNKLKLSGIRYYIYKYL
ncbi:hypothetical protein NA56DRAFT_570141, partial [Hyaloscypha hepaticicola]